MCPSRHGMRGTGSGDDHGHERRQEEHGKNEVARPREQRKLTADELIPILSKKLRVVPGIAVYLRNEPVINLGGRTSKGSYQYTLTSPDLATLYTAAQAAEAKFKTLKSTVDITTDLQIANPQASLQLDRDRAALYGVTPEQIETALYNAYGTNWVSTIYSPKSQNRVILSASPQMLSDPQSLGQLYIPLSSGTQVPLGTIATIREGTSPLVLAREGAPGPGAGADRADRVRVLGARAGGAAR
mgnify:CR=1 FL=1